MTRILSGKFPLWASCLILIVLHAASASMSGGIDSTESGDKLDSVLSQPGIDTVQPAYGGSLKVYSQRGYLDEPFEALVADSLLQGRAVDSTSNGFLSVIDSPANQITLKMEKPVISAAGKPLSSFDIVNLWTSLVRNHPAQGYALFRHVQGIGEFIRGQEVIVRGFGVTDDKTIRLKLGSPDPDAVTRLRTGSLAGSDFMLGSYYVKNSAGHAVVLSANSHHSPAPFLDMLAIQLGGEVNPILNFSLNRCDAMVVGYESDLLYAGRELAGSSVLLPLGQDRYFLSCAADDSLRNGYIRRIVDPSDLLHNFVKGEGHVISLLESDSISPENVAGSSNAPKPPAAGRRIKILFLGDDPPSKAIAGKLFADLTGAGLKCELNGVDEKSYELGLVEKSYGCAIGYVSSAVLTDRAAQLRLASMWFNDQTIEAQRVSENTEIPLFSVQNYLLARKKVHLHDNNLKEIFVKQQQDTANTRTGFNHQ